MAEYKFHHTNFRELRKYIDRVEATEVNFRKFVVRETDEKSGYPRYVAVIKLVFDDGRFCEIECNSEPHKPTDEEAAAIKAELTGVKFPTCVKASKAQVEELLASGKITGEPYVFLDGNREYVITVQERREQKNGGKYYVYWTMFMIEGWKNMEPDEPLPFWKPPKRRIKARIMVHEGAKAAKYCDDLVNDPERKSDLKDHPWGEELSKFEHWGASGGALGVHRCDFEELVIEGGDVVYACDADRPGEIAAQLFSRAWQSELTMLRWDKRFLTGWDLADKVPESVTHVAMWTFAEPATWATKQIGKTSHQRPLYALSEAFASQWVHVVTPEMYINTGFPRVMWAQREFDHHCADFSDGGARISELLKKYPGRVDTINYRPDMETGRHTTIDGVKFFNIHRPRRWESYKKAQVVTPWEDFIEALFPVAEDRRQVKRWAATLIARPDIKMEYGLLLISETQGVGKTTFADILAEILGPSNVTYVSEQQIIGRFTGWVEHQLIICEEIYAGHSALAYDKLKPVITNKTMPVEKKFMAEYDIDNFAHVIACSNSLKALKLEDTDRRWFVPEVVEHKESRDFWVKLHHWLDKQEGYRKVVAWAREFSKREQPVMRGEAAPWTRAKASVIEAFRTDGMEQASSVLSFIKHVYEIAGDVEKLGMNIEVAPKGQIAKLIQLAKQETPCLFFDVDVVEVIRHRFYNGRSDERHPEKPLVVRKLAKEMGLKVADREHCLRLPNWRSSRAHGISIDQATANGATELLKDKNPHRDGVLELINFSELTLELLGPVPM